MMKVLKKGKIMITMYWIILIGILLSAIDVYTYYDYKKNGDKNTLWLSIISDVTLALVKNC